MELRDGAGDDAFEDPIPPFTSPLAEQIPILDLLERLCEAFDLSLTWGVGAPVEERDDAADPAGGEGTTFLERVELGRAAVGGGSWEGGFGGEGEESCCMSGEGGAVELEQGRKGGVDCQSAKRQYTRRSAWCKGRNGPGAAMVG